MTDEGLALGQQPNFYRGFAFGIWGVLDAFEVVQKALDRGVHKELVRSLSVFRAGLRRYAEVAPTPRTERILDKFDVVHTREFCDGYRRAVSSAVSGVEALQACAADPGVMARSTRLFGDMLRQWAQLGADEEPSS